MVKCVLLLATIALAGCSTTRESQLAADELRLVQLGPQLVNCRMGAAPYCKTSVNRGRETIRSCECRQIPYYLGGSRTFGAQRDRH